LLKKITVVSYLKIHNFIFLYKSRSLDFQFLKIVLGKCYEKNLNIPHKKYFCYENAMYLKYKYLILVRLKNFCFFMAFFVKRIDLSLQESCL